MKTGYAMNASQPPSLTTSEEYQFLRSRGFSNCTGNKSIALSITLTVNPCKDKSKMIHSSSRTNWRKDTISPTKWSRQSSKSARAWSSCAATMLWAGFSSLVKRFPWFKLPGTRRTNTRCYSKFLRASWRWKNSFPEFCDVGLGYFQIRKDKSHLHPKRCPDQAEPYQEQRKRKIKKRTTTGVFRKTGYFHGAKTTLLWWGQSHAILDEGCLAFNLPWHLDFTI